MSAPIRITPRLLVLIVALLVVSAVHTFAWRFLIAAALLFPWSLVACLGYAWWHRRHCTRPLICRVCNRKEISGV